VKRCIVSTYQAASGAGQEGMEELDESMRNFRVKDRTFLENDEQNMTRADYLSYVAPKGKVFAYLETSLSRSASPRCLVRSAATGFW